MADTRLTVKRERLIAAINHDAWIVARAGTSENADWRAAVRRLALAAARLDQLDTQQEAGR